MNKAKFLMLSLLLFNFHNKATIIDISYVKSGKKALAIRPNTLIEKDAAYKEMIDMLSSITDNMLNKEEDLPDIDMILEKEEDIRLVKFIINDLNQLTHSKLQGLMIQGRTGLGKTALIKIISNQLKRKVVYTCASSFETAYENSRLESLKEILKRSKSYNPPAVIIIENIECIAPNLDKLDYNYQVINALEFLNNLLKNFNDSPFIIATTTRPKSVNNTTREYFKEIVLKEPNFNQFEKIIKSILAKELSKNNLQINVNNKFIAMLAKDAESKKVCAEVVKDVIFWGIYDYKRDTVPSTDLPLKYTWYLWDGTKLEKNIYDNYYKHLKMILTARQYSRQ